MSIDKHNCSYFSELNTTKFNQNDCKKFSNLFQSIFANVKFGILIVFLNKLVSNKPKNKSFWNAKIKIVIEIINGDYNEKNAAIDDDGFRFICRMQK